MKLLKFLGAVAVFLAILAVVQVISAETAVVIFLLVLACLVFLAMIWPNVRPGNR
jgi:hypothetical protein